MTAPIGKARGEGNCVEVTRRGEEAGASAARLRTETFYKAGRIRRVSTTSRNRPQTIRLVKNELVRRQITFLSGEICLGGLRAAGGETSSKKPQSDMAHSLAKTYGIDGGPQSRVVWPVSHIKVANPSLFFSLWHWLQITPPFSATSVNARNRSVPPHFGHGWFFLGSSCSADSPPSDCRI